MSQQPSISIASSSIPIASLEQVNPNKQQHHQTLNPPRSSQPIADHKFGPSRRTMCPNSFLKSKQDILQPEAPSSKSFTLARGNNSEDTAANRLSQSGILNSQSDEIHGIIDSLEPYFSPIAAQAIPAAVPPQIHRNALPTSQNKPASKRTSRTQTVELPITQVEQSANLEMISNQFSNVLPTAINHNINIEQSNSQNQLIPRVIVIQSNNPPNFPLSQQPSQPREQQLLPNNNNNNNNNSVPQQLQQNVQQQINHSNLQNIVVAAPNQNIAIIVNPLNGNNNNAADALNTRENNNDNNRNVEVGMNVQAGNDFESSINHRTKILVSLIWVLGLSSVFNLIMTLLSLLGIISMSEMEDGNCGRPKRFGYGIALTQSILNFSICLIDFFGGYQLNKHEYKPLVYPSASNDFAVDMQLTSADYTSLKRITKAIYTKYPLIIQPQYFVKVAQGVVVIFSLCYLRSNGEELSNDCHDFTAKFKLEMLVIIIALANILTCGIFLIGYIICRFVQGIMFGKEEKRSLTDFIKKQADKSYADSLIYSDANQLGKCEGQCIICYMDYAVGEQLYKLRCNGRHIFHTECVKQWLKINPCCPICKQTI